MKKKAHEENDKGITRREKVLRTGNEEKESRARPNGKEDSGWRTDTNLTEEKENNESERERGTKMHGKKEEAEKQRTRSRKTVKKKANERGKRSEKGKVKMKSKAEGSRRSRVRIGESNSRQGCRGQVG